MQKFFTQVTENLLEFFRSLDQRRKISLIGVGILIVAISAALIIWATKAHYKLLYTDLSKEDAGTIAQMLKNAKINYEVRDEGKSIFVPEDQVDIWRLEVAKKGVEFSTTIGYEVFDKQAFGTTSFVQKINKQRALEGELMKTIKHIKGVNRARVHLSIPESSPFVSERKPPSASVVLELVQGMTMTKEEIKGIQSLIASSVDGMRQRDVVVLDSKGEKLSENSQDTLAQETANRLALEGKLNERYEKQVEEILKRVVGEGKVIAKVSAKMDFTEAVETKTQYDAENSAVLSEVINSQKMNGRRPSPQGIPGARSNLPGETPQPGIPETTNDVDKTLTTKNYNVPKVVTNSKKPVAELISLSVAVMVDGKRTQLFGKNGEALVNEDGIPQTKYEAWSEAELNKFKQIVATSIGLDEARGDRIVIENMEFAKEDLSQAEALLRQRENKEIMKNLTRYGIIGVFIVLFFFMVIRPFIQWITENTSDSIEDFLPKTIAELERIQANQKLPGLEDVMPTLEDTINPDKIEGNLLKEKIISLIEANPSKAAQVVHEMIHTSESQKDLA